jgi:AAHS family 4-hydroxybenzoate transporter-like MFS transporter
LSQTLHIDALVDEQTIGRFNLNLLIWSFLAMFADGYDLNALPLAAPELRGLWHVPAASFAWALSASSFGILLGAPLLGYVGDRFGRKRAIIIASLICGASSLAIIAAHNLDELKVLRFITGIGIGGLMPNTIALNSELSPKRWRATLVVLMFVGITLGGGAPGLVARWLVPQHGWTALFLVGGLVPLAVAACAWFVLPESIKFLALRTGRRDELLATARRLRPDLSIAVDTQFVVTQAPSLGGTGLREIFAPGLRSITLLLWVCFATTLMTNFFLNSWLPLVGRDNGLSADQASFASSLYSFGGAAGGVLMSVLIDRFGFVVIAALFALSVPAIALIGITGMAYASLVPLVLAAGLTVLGAQFGNNASAGLLYPTAFRAKGVGWALGVGRFGAIAGQLAGGVLLAMHLPVRSLFLMASLPMVVGTVAAALLIPICYARLGTLTLDDAPLGARAGQSRGVLADPASLRAPLP